MVHLAISFILLSTVISHAVAIQDSKIVTGKFIVLGEESFLAANVLRNVTFSTPEHKIELANIATDFLVWVNYAVDTLGTLVINFPEGKIHAVAVEEIQVLNKATNDIQQVLFGGSEQLQEKLVEILETIGQLAFKHQDKLHDVNDRFVNSQMKKDIVLITYAVYKLKYQVKYLENTNKELIPEIRATQAKLTELLKPMSATPYRSEAKLRDPLLIISTMTARIAYKLENWVEVNIDHDRGLDVAQKVAEDLSGVYVKEIMALAEDRNKLRIKDNIIKLFDTICELGTQLANIEHGMVGKELIRSSILDIICIGKTTTETMFRILPKL